LPLSLIPFPVKVM